MPQISAAEFLVRLTPARVWTFVLRLPLTTPSYVALRTASLIPASPIFIRRRMIKKPVTRTASELVLSDQMLTTIFTMTFNTLRNCRRYGNMGSIDASVNLRVDASDRFVSSWWTDDVCDLMSGLSVLNFCDSAGTLILPPAVSFTGKWWASTLGTISNAVIKTWW